MCLYGDEQGQQLNVRRAAGAVHVRACCQRLQSGIIVTISKCIVQGLLSIIGAAAGVDRLSEQHAKRSSGSADRNAPLQKTLFASLSSHWLRYCSLTCAIV